jgi:hypothetical protein
VVALKIPNIRQEFDKKNDRRFVDCIINSFTGYSWIWLCPEGAAAATPEAHDQEEGASSYPDSGTSGSIGLLFCVIFANFSANPML